MYTKAYASRSEEEWTEKTCTRLLEFLLKKQSDLCFLLEENGLISGAVFGSIKPWWDGHHLILEEIFVRPEFHGKGTEKTHLKFLCEKAALSHQATHVEAVTVRDAEFPKNWYFDHAFRELKEWMLIEDSITEVLSTLKTSNQKLTTSNSLTPSSPHSISLPMCAGRQPKPSWSCRHR